MSRPRPANEQDLPALLGITGSGAIGILALFWITNVTLAVTAGGTPMRDPLGVLALVSVLAASIVLVTPGRYPLSVPRVAMVVATVAFSTAAIDWQLPASGSPGYETWQFGANTFLMFALALRGRIIWAWIAMGLMLGVSVAWSLSVAGDGLMGLNLVSRHIGTLIPGTLFAYGLQRTARRIFEFRDAERRRIVAEQRREASADQRAEALAQVRRLALPSLLAIAAREVDDSARIDHRLLEASLRDDIRGRRLSREPVRDSATAARRRGVDVVLMDDAPESEIPESWMELAREWAAGQLDRTESGEATLRVSRDQDGTMVTFTTASLPVAAVFRMGPPKATPASRDVGTGPGVLSR